MNTTRNKNTGPDWGGQNWRPGREPGTWFRHSDQYGPIVHYGTYLVLLREKQRFSREEWRAFLQEKKAAEDHQKWEIERSEKQKYLEQLLEDTRAIAASGDWRICHKTGGFPGTKDGIQKELYEDRFSRCQHYVDIEWRLYFKGVHVWNWTWCGGWRQEQLSTGELRQVGLTSVAEFVEKCLEDHKSSKYAADQISKVLVEQTTTTPKDWSKGTPVIKYPIRVTLEGSLFGDEGCSYYYMAAEEGADPVLSNETDPWARNYWSSGFSRNIGSD